MLEGRGGQGLVYKWDGERFVVTGWITDDGKELTIYWGNNKE